MIIKLICKRCKKEFEHEILWSNQKGKKKYCDECSRIRQAKLTYKIRKEKGMKKRKPKIISVPKLKKRVWKLMSEFVRKRDKCICYTCEKKGKYKKMQAGHFLHNRLDFHYANIHCQCLYCNYYNKDSKIIYTRKMEAEYGKEFVDNLIQEANIKGNDYSRSELEFIQENLKKEISKLEAL